MVVKTDPKRHVVVKEVVVVEVVVEVVVDRESERDVYKNVL